MNMGSSTMSMATSTVASAAATSTSTMDMDMGAGSCQVSMLWNWTTLDACFISSSWHITSRSMFAGSCIGVILLVMSLEFLRRVSKEYDQYILRQFQRSLALSSSSFSSASNPLLRRSSSTDKEKCEPGNIASVLVPTTAVFRPNVVQQAVRALLHMLQFAAAYFIMLLAMYFNGYIIISIIIGAYLGFFVFGWETTVVVAGTTTGLQQQQEATKCCG